MTAVRVAAQAKVNLLLRVLAREASGYHSIETIFARLDMADEVVIRVTPSGRAIDCAGPALPHGGIGPAEQNLAFRAASLYAEASGWPAGFAIEIQKNIPVGAGLGGGSADAGAVLRGLDALAPEPLGPRLLELAAQLGADVPFLTTEAPMALAWGRGERMLLQPPLPQRWIAVAIPAFSVSTADAYGWLAASRGEYEPRGAALRPENVAGWDGVFAVACNDFEPIVAARHPEIASAVAALRQSGASLSMMSGSGSAVFGVFQDEPQLAAMERDVGARVSLTRSASRVVGVTRLD